MGRRRGRRRFRKTRLLEVLACAQACVKPVKELGNIEINNLEVPEQGDSPPSIPLGGNSVLPTGKNGENIVTTKRTFNRLEQKEYYKLYKWLEEHIHNLAPGVTCAQIADMVRKDCAFDCTEWHVKGGLTTCGLSLPKVHAPLSNTEQIQNLAYVVKVLWDMIYPTTPIPEELKRLL